MTPGALKYARLPAGHPEGWYEAMRNLYCSFLECVQAKKDGSFSSGMVDYPTIEDGIDGLAFIEACVESSQKGNIWVDVKH